MWREPRSSTVILVQPNNCRFGCRVSFVGMLLLIGSVGVATSHAESPRKDRGRLKQPVFRVAESERAAPAAQVHPLDAPIRMGREKLEFSRQQIRDYSATLVKREQVGGELLEHQFIFLKVRNERKNPDGSASVPLSVYMRFEGPDPVKGREVLWVKGRNNNKLIAHEGSGFVGLISVWLDPKSAVAMRGQRYPISSVGMENLLHQYVDRLQQDKRNGTPKDFEVKVSRGASVDGRPCTLIKVTHPTRRAYLQKYKSRLFIDEETHLPIRYVTLGWPTSKGAKPAIIEEYTYTKVKLNPGFTDADFNHKNRNYRF